MHEIKLYKSPIRAFKLLALTIPWLIAGFWILLREQPTTKDLWIGWTSVLFFGMGIPIALFHLFDRRPQIIFNEIGILDLTISTEIINWEVIYDAYVTNVQGQKFICLVLNENYEPSRKKGNFYKKVAAFNKAFGFQEVNLNLGQIKINAEKLTDFIKIMSKTDGLNRQKALMKISSMKSF